ncbi:MAG TPA: transglutaminase domain-containing protein [Thermoanaerobaculia bacterium]|nr:transglutaminase domain-containing protein [Thermoanaerobaculia bacterium]
MPIGEARLHYHYPNAAPAPVELWLAQPPECSSQTDVQVTRSSQEPAGTVEVAGNLVTHYRIPPFRALTLEWTFLQQRVELREDAPGAGTCLTAGERSLYLADSPQIPRHPAIEAEAHRLAGGASSPFEAARLFFHALTTGYSYAWPVLDRGALQMLRTRRGDCGQFSSLFVALCRVIGIPARPLVGSLRTPWVDSGHVWAEFWIDGAGWIPADPSRGQACEAMRRRGVMDAEPDRFFGQLGAGYFVFSIGFDLPLGEHYGPPVRPLTLLARLGKRVSFAGRPLRWGFETLAGNLPYLQPAYPRCYSGRGLQALFRCPQLGHWAVEPRQLRWMTFQDVLEQTLVPFLGIVLGIGLLLDSRVPGIALGAAAFTFLTVASSVGLKMWLRGTGFAKRLSAKRGKPPGQ